MFRRKRDGKPGEWLKLYNEDLHHLYTSVGDEITEEEMDRVCGMNGAERMHIGQCSENQKERVHKEDKDVGG
jgi:hypothetical protein